MKIVQARYATPSSSSAELISVISWLLQKDPADRPTIKEILNEVHTIRHFNSLEHDNSFLF
jgi:serine/threonine protein kinase